MKGAEVGDLFMNLIHTRELNGVNPVSYLTDLLRHADDLALKHHGLDAVEIPDDLVTTAVKPCLIAAALCNAAERSPQDRQGVLAAERCNPNVIGWNQCSGLFSSQRTAA